MITLLGVSVLLGEEAKLYQAGYIGVAIAWAVTGSLLSSRSCVSIVVGRGSWPNLECGDLSPLWPAAARRRGFVNKPFVDTCCDKSQRPKRRQVVALQIRPPARQRRGGGFVSFAYGMVFCGRAGVAEWQTLRT